MYKWYFFLKTLKIIDVVDLIASICFSYPQYGWTDVMLSYQLCLILHQLWTTCPSPTMNHFKVERHIIYSKDKGGKLYMMYRKVSMIEIREILLRIALNGKINSISYVHENSRPFIKIIYKKPLKDFMPFSTSMLARVM